MVVILSDTSADLTNEKSPDSSGDIVTEPGENGFITTEDH